MQQREWKTLRLAALFLAASLTACPAATFELVAGQQVSGDVVWVNPAQLELMPYGTTDTTVIPLSTLVPTSRYRALLYRRDLTGQPTPIALARDLRTWGLYVAARRELVLASEDPAQSGMVQAELQAIVQAEDSIAMQAAREELAAGRYASAAGFLERVATSSSSHAGAAMQLLQTHAQAIGQARQKVAAMVQVRRQVRNRARALEEARDAAQRVDQMIQAAEAIRAEVVTMGYPISRQRRDLLEAAGLLVQAADLATYALEGLDQTGSPAEGESDPEMAQEASRLQALAGEARARLMETYCDLADAYLRRGSHLEAARWAELALLMDPQHQRALDIRSATRYGYGGGDLYPYGHQYYWGHPGWGWWHYPIATPYVGGGVSYWGDDVGGVRYPQNVYYRRPFGGMQPKPRGGVRQPPRHVPVRTRHGW